MAGLFDALFSGIASAISDVRQRVVEEGWFGRVVTGDPVDMIGHSAYRGIEPDGRSFEDMWQAQEGLVDKEPAPDFERQRSVADRDSGIDF